jgi:hypothetical protein
MSSGGCPRCWSCWTSVRGSPERGGALGGSRGSAPHAASATPSRAAQHPRQNTRIIQNIADRGSPATVSGPSIISSRLVPRYSFLLGPYCPHLFLASPGRHPSALPAFRIRSVLATPFRQIDWRSRLGPGAAYLGPGIRCGAMVGCAWCSNEARLSSGSVPKGRGTEARRAWESSAPDNPGWTRAAGVGPVPAFDPGSDGTDSWARNVPPPWK